MKLKTLIAALLTALTLTCSGQVLKESESISVQNGYISSLSAAPNDSFYAFSVASWRTIILDHSLEQLREFNYNAMWGGGGPSFSYDNNYVAFHTFGGDSDTLCVYSLSSNDSLKFPVPAQEVKFFNLSNKILITYNGYYSVYDMETGDLSEHVLDVGQAKYRFYSNFFLTSNDSFLIATTNENRLEVYSTHDWSLVKTIASMPSEIGELTGNDSMVSFVSDNQVYVYDLESGVQRDKISTRFESVGELRLAGNLLYIVGTDYPFACTYNLTSSKLSKLVKLKHSKQKSFTILPTENGLLIGDYSNLLFYPN